ncbi:tetratricopeptide repeat protein [Nannocystis sp. SCPEA4]|uniref:tetratricopeptide repeat protein n=1 Tax=Nannocystis sp. SCPEA4 TaxID=2996787 RepID=UPI0022721ED0|nr:tetratricopeptide repeat protein [Nannocystis sp. SCPEA4]MCY1059998.1 tetratricopeptide repeat protein [Nannocystis sp. SCPEA4]
MLHDLAYAQTILGDLAGAEQNLRRALKIWEAALGADDARVGALLTALGDVMVKAGRPGEAVSMLERSVRIAEVQGAPRERVADARVSLARAVWAAHGDREAALAIAEEAAAAYRAAGAVRANFLAELESWMREVSARPAPRRVEPRAR